MKKITNYDINQNVNSIITIGNFVLFLFILTSLVYFSLGIYYVYETEEGIYFLTYSVLYPLIYIAIGLAIRIFLKWAAYLLKTLLDIKNSIYKTKTK